MTECVQRMNMGHSPHHSIIRENKITSTRLGKLQDLEDKSPYLKSCYATKAFPAGVLSPWPKTSRDSSMYVMRRELRTGPDLRETTKCLHAWKMLWTPRPSWQLIGLVWTSPTPLENLFLSSPNPQEVTSNLYIASIKKTRHGEVSSSSPKVNWHALAISSRRTGWIHPNCDGEWCLVHAHSLIKSGNYLGQRKLVGQV